MTDFLFVGLGGFIGSCLRFSFSKWEARLALTLPLATFAANVLAGILIGFVIGLEKEMGLDARARAFLTAGLAGGLSTFSAFSLETVKLWQAGSGLLAAGNVIFNLGFSLGGVLLGLTLAKALTARA
ncbi:MAG: CrcB family protein [Deltaproteobacteria bacterium]|jgi:CrcB protein|nr:CrcB family protein [Deltaproteobacteria bacterium]